MIRTPDRYQSKIPDLKDMLEKAMIAMEQVGHPVGSRSFRIFKLSLNFQSEASSGSANKRKICDVDFCCSIGECSLNCACTADI